MNTVSYTTRPNIQAAKRITSSFSVATLVLLLTTAVSACGSPGQSPATSVSADIKALQGGTLVHPGGATLTIPPGALSGDAQVVLRDNGKANHPSGDPLSYVSEAFSVEAHGANGGAVKLNSLVKLSLTASGNTSGNAPDFLVATVTSAQPGVIMLRGGKTGAAKSSIIAAYEGLGDTVWIVAVPDLPPPPTDETRILQVPWYDGMLWNANTGAAESINSWDLPTTMTDLLRYYDVAAQTDPLNSTFGSSTALANWQIAAMSHVGTGTTLGDSWLRVFSSIGVKTPPLFGPADPGTPSVQVYEWDPYTMDTNDDLKGYIDGILYSPAAHWPILLYENNIDELLQLGRATSFVITGAWSPTSDIPSGGVYIHEPANVDRPDAAIGGAISHQNSWTNLKYRLLPASKQRAHLYTAVLYGPQIKPEAQRCGSIVMSPQFPSFLDDYGRGGQLQLDGASPHDHGYYFRTSSLLNGGSNQSDLGVAASRGARLGYSYQIANVTNTRQTFTSVAELSGPTYGAGLVSQTHTVTVDPYSLSEPISGAFDQQPTAGSGAFFDVRLFEVGSTSTVQDVKFFRYNVQDGLPLQVKITAPADNAHVVAGSPDGFAATAIDTNGGTQQPVPDSYITWASDGQKIGTGASISATFDAAGTHTITVTATTPSGATGSATIHITVDPKPTSVPASVGIVSPTPNQIIGEVVNGSAPATLVATGSPGMQFSWTDSIQGNLGSGITLNVRLVATPQTCYTNHTITLHGVDDQGRTAQASVIVVVQNTGACVH